MKKYNVSGKKGGDCTDFDSAISLTGYGRFHYEIIVTSALCILAAGFQNNLSGYIFPAAQCELNLSSKEVGFLNAFFLVGGTCSSFMWGVLADVNGRRKVLIFSLIVDFVVTTIFALTVSNFVGLAVCRFLNGFLVGAPGSITFAYLAEFHAPEIRAKTVCYSGAFFTSAWLILPIAAYVVLPMNVDLVVKDIFKLNSWRLLFFLLVLPELLAAIWLLRLPESPKFALARGDADSTVKILKRMYSVNYSKSEEDYPIKYITSDLQLGEKTDAQHHNNGNKILRELKYAAVQVQSLFQQPLVYLTLLMCAVMFANMFGFFGLGLWLPELFIRFEEFHLKYPNLTTSLKELSSMEHAGAALDCTPKFDWSVFVNTAALGICCLLGNIVSGLLAGRLHLKTLPLVTMLVAGVSSFSIYFLNSSQQILIVSCLFLSTIATCNLTLGSVAIELFPTSVNAMAYCLMLCIGRLAAICSNVAFGYLFDDHCELPIFIVSGITLVGCGLCFIIPKRLRKAPAKVNKDISISVIESVKCGGA